MQQRHKPAKPNQVRIIGGAYRSRKLSFPDVVGLRPTGDRVRETLFNWLTPHIASAHCLDLFAGSGALGLEALSRGANHVTFVDSSSLACESIGHNLDKLDIDLRRSGRARVICADSQSWLDKQTEDKNFNIIFLDPPFVANMLGACCAKIAQQHLLLPGGNVYVERAKYEKIVMPNNWLCIKDKQTGSVGYQLFRQL